ncbi:hypothetical protein E8E12_008850 [Didymella heteroderae]|uniref:Uncharacterized protein n=1 Tax=Didymella heteroderae TaxID=1769908 RepID=A0A9P4WS73_9PLEO|nr:hypothetical protein E8E12_008850 [Didymella heteroderae]
MPYLVGDLIKELATDGPVTSFTKSFNRLPKLDKEREALALDEKKSKAAQKNQATKAQRGPEEDWVKKKWLWYYETNTIGEMKLNFSKMSASRFEQYTKDAQAQGRHSVGATSRHLGAREMPAVQSHSKQDQEEKVVKTKVTMAALEQSRKRKAVAPTAESKFVCANDKSHARKKPLVKAHLTQEEYLKKH